MTISQTQIEEWERLAGEATAGPWVRSGVRHRMNGGEWHSINRYDEAKKQDENLACVGYNPRTNLGMADAAFIAASREAVPVLIEEVRKLTERCSGYRGQVEAGAAEIEASREEVKRLRNALEDAETALDAVLYENSDKSEADRIRDRVVAAVVLANARSALIGESTT